MSGQTCGSLPFQPYLAPLIQDSFWISMALTIMFGLTFGKVLTMVMVPVFYATVYKVRSPQ
jgi:multidrug efflux pump subunit AcrB